MSVRETLKQNLEKQTFLVHSRSLNVKLFHFEITISSMYLFFVILSTISRELKFGEILTKKKHLVTDRFLKRKACRYVISVMTSHLQYIRAANFPGSAWRAYMRFSQTQQSRLQEY